MPKATENHITPAPATSGRMVGRRALALAGGAFASLGLIAGTAATVAAEVPSPDTELLAACAELSRLYAYYRKTNDLQEALPHPFSDRDGREWDRLDALVTETSLTMEDLEQKIASLPARSRQEEQAKAQAVLLGLTYGRASQEFDSQHPGATLAFSLAMDLLGRAAA